MNFVGSHYARYLSLGFSVIPVKTLPYVTYEIPPGFDAQAKKPLIKWEQFQQRLPTLEEALSWSRHWPHSGIAVCTGAISDAAAIDDDRSKRPPLTNRTKEQEAEFQSLALRFGGESALRDFYRAADDLYEKLMELPTARARSGKGKHFWFRMPRNDDGVIVPLGSSVKFLPGWDTRADGGYIIVPPSVHPCGSPYVWERTPEEGILPMPRWVHETITRLPAFAKVTAMHNGRPAWSINHDVFQGFRNNTMAAWYGGQLRGSTFYHEDTWPQLYEISQMYNQQYMKPPIPDDELQATFLSIARKERERRGREGIYAEPEPVCITAAELATKKLTPPGFAVRDLFVDGTTALFGKPKAGKSYLLMQTSLAVATGQPLFPSNAAMYAHANHPQGFGTQQGSVLHLALEDSEIRLQTRMREIVGSATGWPTSIEFFLTWPACYDGGLVKMERWLDAHADARCIIIDIAAVFLNTNDQTRGSLFRAEYHLFRPVVELSKARKVPIIIADHASKGKGKAGSSDPFDSGAGTLGSQAAIDSSMVLEHSERGTFARLHYKGRDIERGFLDLEHTIKSPVWKVRTTFDEVKAARESKRVNGSHQK